MREIRRRSTQDTALSPSLSCYQIDLYLPAFLSWVKEMRSRLKKPSKTDNEYLFALFHHLPQTVNILKTICRSYLKSYIEVEFVPLTCGPLFARPKL